jgi:6-hydroxycyclohex-1-ene-1-carbonyl-CoA dehydrogenase
MSPTTVSGWMMTAPGVPLEWRSYEVGDLPPGDALVQVAGCGVCHTDVSFLHMGVKTRAALPLVLGHEVAGTVLQVGAGVDDSLVGRPVVVPAVLPCGECDPCRSGHATICRAQLMPGNDRHGGFATHVVVPARWLCPVPPRVLERHKLWQLSVVADAVSTPFMSVQRAAVKPGDFALVVGAGGIGIHCVQVAAAAGAQVVALDVDDGKLAQAREFGASAVINVRGMDERAVKDAVRAAAKAVGAPSMRWKIFETSGTAAGQATAFNSLNHGAYLAIVGFTMDKVEVRLSNLMAFDATVRGNWGCDPALYPQILEWIADGRLRVAPLVKRYPLAEANAVLDAAHHGGLAERAVLVP